MNSIEKLEQINSIVGNLIHDAKDTMGKDDPEGYNKIVSRHEKIVAETEDLKKEYKGV